MSLRLGTLATCLALATAQQQSIFQIPFYGYDTQSIDASIVGITNSATTLQLACPSGTDGNDCGLFPSQTLTYGPSTYHMDLGVGSAGAFTGTQDCSRQGTTSAVCTESNGGSEANFAGMSTTSYETGDVAVLPVTVTAGGEKLGASAGGVASASASATATATSSVSVILVSGTAGASSSLTTASRSGAGSGTATQSAAAAAAGSSSAATARLKGCGPGAIAAVLGVLGWAVL